MRFLVPQLQTHGCLSPRADNARRDSPVPTDHASHVICFEKVELKELERRVAMVSRLSRDRCRREAAARLLTGPSFNVETLTSSETMRRSPSDTLLGSNSSVQSWWSALVHDDASASIVSEPEDEELAAIAGNSPAHAPEVYFPSSPKRPRGSVGMKGGNYDRTKHPISDDWTTTFLNRTRGFSVNEESFVQ